MKNKKWIVYILKLNDNSYYTGITNNLTKRLKAHRNGKGSKYVASRLPLSVVYIYHEDDRSSASIQEFKIKKLSRKNKELLVKGKLNLRDKEVHFFCENCSAVIVIKRNELELLDNTENKFSMRCIVCGSIITHEERN
jgi:putative endonuclease